MVHCRQYRWNIHDSACDGLYRDDVFSGAGTPSAASTLPRNTSRLRSQPSFIEASRPDNVLSARASGTSMNSMESAASVAETIAAKRVAAGSRSSSATPARHFHSVLFHQMHTQPRNLRTLDEIPRNPCAVAVAPFCSSNYHSDELPQYLFVADPAHVRVRF